ncbi:hypothetical protein JCM13210_13250 [Thermaerobacter litoralis]
MRKAKKPLWDTGWGKMEASVDLPGIWANRRSTEKNDITAAGQRGRKPRGGTGGWALNDMRVAEARGRGRGWVRGWGC